MTPSSAGAGRIVVVTTSYPSYPGDASGHFVEAEVRALANAGHSVVVLAPRVDARGATSSNVRARGATSSKIDARRVDARVDTSPHVEVRWLPAGDAFGWPGALARLEERPSRAFGMARFGLAARQALARLENIERVIAHFLLPSAWPIASVAEATKLEVVIHGSDLGLLERLPLSLRRHIARRLQGTRVRTVSEDLRTRLARALGDEFAARAQVLPSPLDFGELPERGAARRALGVGEDERVVAVVGRLVAGKRGERALNAAALVPHARVVVVGDGPERPRLESAFPRAAFVGHVARERALEWLAAADVLLSASDREGAPSVVREARALGTRVVAWSAGDLAAWSRDDPGLCVVGGAS